MRTNRIESDQDAHITPDAAIRLDCPAELGHCADRWFRYPLTNCAKGGGPHVQLVDSAGRPIEGDPIAETGALLRAGRIVAIEGIGGFQLACRADSQDAVLRLRARKRRESKPLAVMVPDLEVARRCGRVDAFNEGLLISPARPIVLVPERQSSPLAPAVSSGSPWVGLMLPYAPLHHLLFTQGLPPLVMTSGHRRDQPLATSRSEAIERLRDIADAYLTPSRGLCTCLSAPSAWQSRPASASSHLADYLDPGP